MKYASTNCSAHIFKVVKLCKQHDKMTLACIIVLIVPNTECQRDMNITLQFNFQSLYPLRNGGGAIDPTAHQNTHKCPDSRAANPHCKLQVKSDDVGVSATPPLVLHLHGVIL